MVFLCNIYAQRKTDDEITTDENKTVGCDQETDCDDTHNDKENEVNMEQVLVNNCKHEANKMYKTQFNMRKLLNK